MVIRAARINLKAGEINFLDSKDVSSWAASAVYTTFHEGIIIGYLDNTFKPKGNATRAEATTVIIRAIE